MAELNDPPKMVHRSTKMVLYGKNETPANVVVGWIKDEAKGEMRLTSAYIKEV